LEKGIRQEQHLVKDQKTPKIKEVQISLLMKRLKRTVLVELPQSLKIAKKKVPSLLNKFPRAVHPSVRKRSLH